MSNHVSRYSMKYAKRVPSNSVTTFPKHVFMRAQQKPDVSIYDRIGDK